MPVFKKGSKNSKENYRHVSILAYTSKIYGRGLFKQTLNYFEDIFSKFQCGFRKYLSIKQSYLNFGEFSLVLKLAGIRSFYVKNGN